MGRQGNAFKSREVVQKRHTHRSPTELGQRAVDGCPFAKHVERNLLRSRCGCRMHGLEFKDWDWGSGLGVFRFYLKLEM